jgi:glycosyltransferase involved in cell wall biosynthesis
VRLVIDLQGAQGVNRDRGIGRLTRALARAMIANAGCHEPLILLNAAQPDSAAALHEEFSTLLPRENIRVWRGLNNTGAIGGPGNVARRRAAEIIRAQYIAGLAADVVHVSSVVEGADDNTITNWPSCLERPPHVATFYDAIPLINHEQYLCGAWKHLVNWYLAQIQEIRLCDGLLAISQSSGREAVDYLGFSPETVFNVRAGFDPVTFRPVRLEAEDRAAFLARHDLRDGYVLFVGAGDARKNERGLIEAYGLLPEALQARHQLVIVGVSDPASLRELAASKAISPGDLALPAHVPEAEMATLYSTCGLFVMPSKHEGFGLPALEAMACGAPVIASNTTSLPEVVGAEEALFDPSDPQSIADRMRMALEDTPWRLRLGVQGLHRAQQFTWQESARRSWAALEAMEERSGWRRRQPLDSAPRRKPRLAIAGGFPATQSGAAANDVDFVSELARYYDITLVVRSPLREADALGSAFPTLPEKEFAASAGRFDRILYRVGAADIYGDILGQLLPQCPGVVILHDACLVEIHLAEYQRHGDRDALARALFESHGWHGIAAMHENDAPGVADKLLCTTPVFRNALCVVHHTAAARDRASRPIGVRAVDVARVIPPARRVPPLKGRLAARAALGLETSCPVAVSIGHFAGPQDGLETMQAWHRTLGTLPGARLAFVGSISAAAKTSLSLRADDAGVGDRIMFVTDTDDVTRLLWLEAADIAVQLETGWRGEALDAVLDALAVGLPVLAAAEHPASELPPGSVCLLPPGAETDEVAVVLSDLWSDVSRRAKLAEAGQHYVLTSLNPRLIARQYQAVIEEAFTHGPIARLQACLPSISEDDYADAARALAESFQSLGPRRLLLEVGCAEALGSSGVLAFRDLARLALLGPEFGWIAELVRFDEGTPRLARDHAARLLNLPTHGLTDEPIIGGTADTVVLPADGQYDLAELRALRRRGVCVVALIREQLSETLPGAVELADFWLCASPELAKAALVRLEDGVIKRELPVEIGWLTADGHELFQLLSSDHWPMRWPRPCN